MDYQKKYIKYKNKYIQLKNKIQIGGVFNNIKYLGQGTESIIFELANGRVIRITRKGVVEETEKEIVSFIISNPVPYFPKYYEIGECLNDTLVNMNISSFCEGVKYRYEYIIMEKIVGKRIYGIFLDYFKDDIRNELVIDVDRLNSFKNAYICIIKKIIKGLIYANDKMNGFCHRDFVTENCLIRPVSGDPVFIDFGRSIINFGKTLNISKKRYNDVYFYNSEFLAGYWIKAKYISVGDLYNLPSVEYDFVERVHSNCKILLRNFNNLSDILKLTELINDTLSKQLNEGGSDITLDLSTLLENINKIKI